MFHALTPLKETRAYREILAEGEAEGEARGLKRMLTRRFGALPDWAIQRINSASLEQLDAWVDGFLDAESVSGLLGCGQH